MAGVLITFNSDHWLLMTFAYHYRWGHDFRPEYRRINEIRNWDGLKEYFQGAAMPKSPIPIPMVALTATASIRVQQDIERNLLLYRPHKVVSSFDRPNLKYIISSRVGTGFMDVIRVLLKKKEEFRQEQKQKQKRKQNMEPSLDGVAGMGSTEEDSLKSFAPTLIYVRSRNECEELVRALHNHGNGTVFDVMGIAFYHAGLSVRDRERIHRAFIHDEISIVVATIAFGMGIHKPDIRLVIHVGIPSSLEAYYQQVGRAGRDGDYSECYLFYNSQDPARVFAIATNASMTNAWNSSSSHSISSLQARVKSGIAVMTSYATQSTVCRRLFLLDYFSEHPTFSMNNVGCGSVGNSDNGRDILQAQRPPQQHCCDVCDAKRWPRSSNGSSSGEGTVIAPLEVGFEIKILLETVREWGGIFGLGVIIGLLVGSREKSLSRIDDYELYKYFSAGKHHTRDWWKHFAYDLVSMEGLLETSYKKGGSGSGYTYQVYSITQKGKVFLDSCHEWEKQREYRLQDGKDQGPMGQKCPSYVISPSVDLRRHCAKPNSSALGNAQIPHNNANESGGTVTKSQDVWTDTLMTLLEVHLRRLRQKIAIRMGISAYAILSTPDLKALVTYRPVCIEELALLPGWGEAKIEKFGMNFLKEGIEEFVKNNDLIPTIRATYDLPESTDEIETFSKVMRKASNMNAYRRTADGNGVGKANDDTRSATELGEVAPSGQQCSTVFRQTSAIRSNSVPPTGRAISLYKPNYKRSDANMPIDNSDLFEDPFACSQLDKYNLGLVSVSSESVQGSIAGSVVSCCESKTSEEIGMMKSINGNCTSTSHYGNSKDTWDEVDMWMLPGPSRAPTPSNRGSGTPSPTEKNSVGQDGHVLTFADTLIDTNIEEDGPTGESNPNPKSSDSNSSSKFYTGVNMSTNANGEDNPVIRAKPRFNSNPRSTFNAISKKRHSGASHMIVSAKSCKRE